MNKLIILSVAAVCLISSVFGGDCNLSNVGGLENFSDFKNKCTRETENQIKMEIGASLSYLSMGAFFSRDEINRPGFAKFFFDAASEEREHAGKLIDYLTMRGRYLNDVTNNFNTFNISSILEGSNKFGNELKSPGEKTTSGLEALRKALALEKSVTESIRNLVITCEADDSVKKGEQPFNHFHFVDYLTGEFLEEQYKGQRDIAGKISTLGKMVRENGAELADFLFDKQLL